MQGVAGSDSTYASLALYVSGNAVLAAAVFILLGVSKILASFQQPILWALISCIALREAKDAWVRFLDAELRSKSLPGFLLSICMFPCFWLLGGSSTSNANSETGQEGDERKETAHPAAKSTATSWFLIGWLFRGTIMYSFIAKFQIGGQGSLFSSIVSTAVAIACAAIAHRILKLADDRLGKGVSDKQNSLSQETAATSHTESENPVVSQRGVAGIDRKLRDAIRSRLHGLVAATLILSVMVITVFSSIFITIQIIGESRIAVAKIDNVIRTSQEKADFGGILTYVKGYQEDALLKLQASMPDVRELVLARVEGYLVANNLSHAVGDVQELFERLVGSGPCEPETHKELMINLAACRSTVFQLSQEQKLETDMYVLLEGYLNGNLSAWDEARRMPSLRLASKEAARMDKTLSECHSAVKQAKMRVDEVNSRMQTAENNMNLADIKLQRCEDTQADDPARRNSDSGIPHEIFQRLQSVYNRLLHGEVSKASEEVHDIWNLARSASASGSLSSLQEAAYLVVQPLLAAGQGLLKVATSGLGSTTTFIFSSGAGLFKFGLSIVQSMFQLMLYGTLLLYLLASDQDPLLQALNLLPVSDENRLQARNAIGRAMGSVFSSAIKLASFHALFTYLTFVAFGVDMPCLSAVTSMIMALLPFVPIWFVSLPAALQVFIQGNSFAAIVLVVLHVAASSYVDDMVLQEIPGSVPSLTGLGIVGGMYTFSNPLQGAILGPMLLALLSVAYNLHLVFMKADGGGA